MKNDAECSRLTGGREKRGVRGASRKPERTFWRGRFVVNLGGGKKTKKKTQKKYSSRKGRGVGRWGKRGRPGVLK